VREGDSKGEPESQPPFSRTNPSGTFDFHIKPIFRLTSQRKFGEENTDIVHFLRRYPEALS
jgi:hypothetical protein